MSKTALITGSAGFVGRHLYDALEDRGYEVIGIDVKEHPNSGDARWWAMNVDVRYDLVVHCAAVVGGRAKIDGAPLEVAYDFGLDSDVVQFCARTKPGRVVFFSSSAAYPIVMQDGHPGIQLREDFISPRSILQPDAIYGLCKIVLERQAAELVKLGIPVHVFRPFSGYGSDQDDGYPWPDIMKRVLNHEDLSQPFELWSRPSQTRDWIHIDDVVAQVMACLDQDVRGPINLCTGYGQSFGNLVRLAFSLCDTLTVPEIVHDKTKPSGVAYRVGDPTRINRVLPAKIMVAEGIERTFAELHR